MAVTLPSDLILDVMKKADPARRQVAVARLQSAAGEGSEFAMAVDRVSSSHPLGSNGPLPALGKPMARAAAGTEGKGASAYEGFEKMVLRNLFESLLPGESSGMFGSGPSAGVWRSMAAEQLAGVYADTGGLGISRMVQSSDQAAGPRQDAQWPYFALKPIKLMSDADAA